MTVANRVAALSPKLFMIVIGSALALLIIFTSYTSTQTRLWHAKFFEPKVIQGPISRIEPVLRSSRATQPTLDIVISMFKEKPEQLGKMIHELKELEPLQGLNTNVHIYVKDVKADTRLIQEKTGATNVTILLNAGREAGTYLTHILRQWDDLARHTMFVQAEMHYYDGARDRVTDFFEPRTGFLSLGYYHKCDCVKCTDWWDKDRSYPRIQELYAALNGELCPKEITLTYLGQFIVSAKRIRSRTLSTYKYIQEILQSDEDHFIHSDPKQDWFGDEESNPYYGHTMERAWNVLWNCADLSIYKRCAGTEALSERRASDQAADSCQCID